MYVKKKQHHPSFKNTFYYSNKNYLKTTLCFITNITKQKGRSKKKNFSNANEEIQKGKYHANKKQKRPVFL